MHGLVRIMRFSVSTLVTGLLEILDDFIYLISIYFIFVYFLTVKGNLHISK